MADWSLPRVLESLHKDIEHRLEIARTAIGHPGDKGDTSESIWISILQSYLPRRYRAEKAHVVDSKGAFSDQIDVVIFDRAARDAPQRRLPNADLDEMLGTAHSAPSPMHGLRGVAIES
jgi:hypothetical protein